MRRGNRMSLNASEKLKQEIAFVLSLPVLLIAIAVGSGLYEAFEAGGPWVFGAFQTLVLLAVYGYLVDSYKPLFEKDKKLLANVTIGLAILAILGLVVFIAFLFT
ncbi:MAG: hypothetical protein JW834_04170 [Candidatus Diapherotrites archaeon]|nr:hypothetical protein [Candidatus Diapherotrites archaeon]